MALSKQVHLFLLDTSAFYNDTEYEIPWTRICHSLSGFVRQVRIPEQTKILLRGMKDLVMEAQVVRYALIVMTNPGLMQ